jgi:hypothetical protein
MVTVGPDYGISALGNAALDDGKEGGGAFLGVASLVKSVPMLLGRF